MRLSLQYDKDEGDELLEMFLNFTLFGEYEQKGEMSYTTMSKSLSIFLKHLEQDRYGCKPTKEDVKR
ncbi:hypothetical protein H5410_012647 [Solanum commersonii]|uniref:Uncharacterized protein n=1 Tax=Solanum commersonii TaxID=4109 RepID=A0A9J6AS80_SOLCO|nr:hypothetical protein H5410_012647 [Solanum commersonii]